MTVHTSEPVDGFTLPLKVAPSFSASWADGCR
jgi:hypothetical protein